MLENLRSQWTSQLPANLQGRLPAQFPVQWIIALALGLTGIYSGWNSSLAEVNPLALILTILVWWLVAWMVVVSVGDLSHLPGRSPHPNFLSFKRAYGPYVAHFLTLIHLTGYTAFSATLLISSAHIVQHLISVDIPWIYPVAMILVSCACSFLLWDRFIWLVGGLCAISLMGFAAYFFPAISMMQVKFWSTNLPDQAWFNVFGILPVIAISFFGVEILSHCRAQASLRGRDLRTQNTIAVVSFGVLFFLIGIAMLGSTPTQLLAFSEAGQRQTDLPLLVSILFHNEGVVTGQVGWVLAGTISAFLVGLLVIVRVLIDQVDHLIQAQIISIPPTEFSHRHPRYFAIGYTITASLLLTAFQSETLSLSFFAMAMFSYYLSILTARQLLQLRQKTITPKGIWTLPWNIAQIFSIAIVFASGAAIAYRQMNAFIAFAVWAAFLALISLFTTLRRDPKNLSVSSVTDQ